MFDASLCRPEPLRRAVAMLTMVMALFCGSTVMVPDLAIAKSFPLKEKQGCVTAECHPNMGKDKYVHGPVASGDCRFCHKAEKPDRHEFKPIKDVAALCYACHDKLHLGPVVHKPVKDGNCTGCHNPHQSGHNLQLRGGGRTSALSATTNQLLRVRSNMVRSRWGIVQLATPTIPVNFPSS